MFTSIRLITIHCTLALGLALGLALAACADSPGGGGPCPSPGSTGSLDFTFPSGTFTAACFSATSDGGSVTFTSLPPAAGETAAVLQLTLQARDALRDVCPWYPGASASLSSSCVDMSAEARNGDSVLQRASSGVGTVTASDWGTGPGQLVSVFFSSGAALALDNGGGADGGSSLVPFTGTASTLISEP